MMSLWMCMCLDLIRSRNFILLIHMQHCDLFSSLWFYDNCSNTQLLIGILAVLLFPFPRWHLCIMCIILNRLLVRSLMQLQLIKRRQTIMQSKQQRTSWSPGLIELHPQCWWSIFKHTTVWTSTGPFSTNMQLSLQERGAHGLNLIAEMFQPGQ